MSYLRLPYILHLEQSELDGGTFFSVPYIFLGETTAGGIVVTGGAFFPVPYTLSGAEPAVEVSMPPAEPSTVYTDGYATEYGAATTSSTGYSDSYADEYAGIATPDFYADLFTGSYAPGDTTVPDQGAITAAAFLTTRISGFTGAVQIVRRGSVVIRPIATAKIRGIVTGAGQVVLTPSTLAEYRVVVKNLQGEVLDEVPAHNLQYAFALNDVGTMGFTLPVTHPKCKEKINDFPLLWPGKRQIVVWRNGRKVWGGYLLSADVSTSDDSVRFSCEGFLWRLRRRVVTEDLDYERKEQLDTAWKIIQWAQDQTNGDMGIRRYDPSEDSGVLRTTRLRGFERPNIGETLQSMTEIDDGFDYEMTPDNEWRTFYPQRGNETNLIFELGKNIGSVQYTIDAEELTTKVYGLGAGDGRGRCIAPITNTQGLSDYGLLEETIELSDMRYYDDLYATAKEYLKRHKYPRAQPQMTVMTSDPPFASYSVGDRVRVIAKHGYIDFDKTMRIVSENVQVDNTGHEAIQLFFDEVQVPAGD